MLSSIPIVRLCDSRRKRSTGSELHRTLLHFFNFSDGLLHSVPSLQPEHHFPSSHASSSPVSLLKAFMTVFFLFSKLAYLLHPSAHIHPHTSVRYTPRYPLSAPLTNTLHPHTLHLHTLHYRSPAWTSVVHCPTWLSQATRPTYSRRLRRRDARLTRRS